eukprot:5099231-Pleurochrysis_carterae.AAC.1
MWVEHVAGIGNALADAGSHQYWHTLHALASASGIRLRQRALTPRALAFMSDALELSTPLAPKRQRKPELPPPRTTALSPELFGKGRCPSDVAFDGAHGDVLAAIDSPPRLLCTPRRRPAPQLLHA